MTSQMQILKTAMVGFDVFESVSDDGESVAQKLTTETAREMAAARRDFRGGRPVRPRKCPRCGMACASTSHALAHCVGRKPEYPRVKYHATKPPVVVANREAERALGKGWADTPAAFK